MPAYEDLLEAYTRKQTAYAAAMGFPESGEGPTKLVLSVDDSKVAVELFDRQGRRLDRTSVPYSMSPIYVAPLSPPIGTAPATNAALDPVARRMIEALGAPSGSLRPENLPEEVLHPESHDPLGFAREGVLALGTRTEGQGFVAALSDDMVRGLDFVKEGSLDVAAFARRFGRAGGFERLAQDGFAVVRPTDALESEAHTVDREILGREFRRIVASRDIGSRSWSRFQFALYTGLEQPVADLYAAALLGLGLHGPIPTQHSNGEYALVGAALASHATPADASVAPFRHLVKDGLVKGWLRFTTGVSDLAATPFSLLRELSGGKVGLSGKETPVAEQYGSMSAAEIRRVSMRGDEPEALGARAVARLGPLSSSQRTPEGMLRLLDGVLLSPRYRLGRRLDTVVEVTLRNGAKARVQLQDQAVDRDSLVFGELPEAFREAVLRGARRTVLNPPDFSVPRRPVGERTTVAKP